MVTKFVMPCAKLKCGAHCLKIIRNVNDDSLNQESFIRPRKLIDKKLSFMKNNVYLSVRMLIIRLHELDEITKP